MISPRTFSRRALALATGVWLVGTAVSAQAPTASVLFQRAGDREVSLRTAASPTPKDVRGAIAAYELVVRKFPKSGFCDNALWQAAGVALFAYDRTGSAADRASGERLLTWLTSEYPASPFAPRADERRQAFSASAAVPEAPAAPAVLRTISREPLPGGDRIVLEVDREVAFTSDRIANPDRVFLDLAATGVGDGVSAQASALKGLLIAGVRLGRPAQGMTRVVVDLAGAPKHSVYPLYSPYRLVIDAEGPPVPPLVKELIQEPLVNTPGGPPTTPNAPLEIPERPAAAVATTPAASLRSFTIPSTAVVSIAPPSVTRSGGYSLARQLGLSVQRIVIDAGHGGHDPGAQGNGVIEKDLVLDVALRLQKLFQAQPGVEVTLTRGTDEFIPLEERTAIANRAGADLFLSIHANASTRKEARGLETYFLNFATTPEAQAVAARENAASSQGMGHLSEILRAIALNNKLAESRELATMVQTSLVRRLRQQNSRVRDLGVKQAPFVVLIGAQMPSVLTEVSFLTNKSEASLLKQASYKQRIAQSLFDAVVKYQSSLKRITTVAAKGSRR